MRIIGHLPDEASATTFSDFLYVRGILNTVEAEPEGWAVWIHSEDELENAQEFLRSFRSNPHDPVFHQESRQARELKEREARAEKAAGKKIFTRRRLCPSATAHGRGPLTVTLVVVCVALWLYGLAGGHEALLGALLISKFVRGLPEIFDGQVWRLFTPVLLHAGPLHLFFNMLWLLDLGGMIEGRQGTGRLAALVVALAVVSNLGQFFLSGPLFYGMSGVVYGLLGYVWMKGKFDPASGLFVHQQTVTMMLIWFFLCLTGLLGNIANGAHAFGLVAGMAWGWLSSLRPAAR